MTSPVCGGRYEHRWMRRTAAREAFRPQQLRAHLALRLGLAQAQRDAARDAAYGAPYAPFGGDHLLQEIARVHDGAADAGARDRALLHAGYGSVKGITCRGVHVEVERFRRRCHRTHPPRDGQRAAAVLLDYPIYVLACTCLLPRQSREILSPARTIDDFFGAFIGRFEGTVLRKDKS